MSEKRYQVFISSTFKDLSEERKAIMDAILNLDCFPSGMEMFPASDMEQFEYIKSIIEESDYYILVVSGKYGSISDAGISYTEMEYDYAKEKGIPILTFIKKDITQLTGDKIELEIEKREKLERFRSKISENSLVKYWNNIDELKYNVYDSLSKAIKMIKRTGWIRGDIETDSMLLRQINDLRIDNKELQDKLTTINMEKDDKLIQNIDSNLLAQGDDEIVLEYMVMFYLDMNHSVEKIESIKFTWNELFSIIGYELLQSKLESELAEAINQVIFDKQFDCINEKYEVIPAYQNYTTIDIRRKELKKILFQFIYLGLIKEEVEEIYTLTEKGRVDIIDKFLVKK